MSLDETVDTYRRVLDAVYVRRHSAKRDLLARAFANGLLEVANHAPHIPKSAHECTIACPACRLKREVGRAVGAIVPPDSRRSHLTTAGKEAVG